MLIQIAKERITAGQLSFDLEAMNPTAPTGVAPTVTVSRSRVLWEVLEAAHRRLGDAVLLLAARRLARRRDARLSRDARRGRGSHPRGAASD